MKRVVITGCGLVTPLGCGVQPVWRRLLAGRSGVRRLPDRIVSDVASKIAGVVPDKAEDPEAGFDPSPLAPAKEMRHMDRFIQFAVMAADEAIQHAGFAPSTDAQRSRTATVIASGIGGF